jgi:Transposase DDE domain
LPQRSTIRIIVITKTILYTEVITMIPDLPQSVTLVRLVDKIPPLTDDSPPPHRGRDNYYPDRLFLKGAVIMQLKQVHRVNGLLAILNQQSCEMQMLRAELSHEQRFPSRRTWERRIAELAEVLEQEVANLGCYLLAKLDLWAASGRGLAMDSTKLEAYGGVWHKTDRKAGKIPHSSIDTEAAWGKSGYHGWWYGWKLHLAVTVGDIWIPVAARLTEANLNDGVVGAELFAQLPAATRMLLGDSHYHTEKLQELCAKAGCTLVCSRGKRKRVDDDPGREVRRELHKLRSVSIENWNEQYKGLFDVHGKVPTKGKRRTQRFALSGVIVYQLLVWHHYEQGLDPRKGLKATLKAA